ncbi:hypothetical protein F5882DRAFT_404801 [Hyaloscypha sp. PMI_1271]|nr:hypothetical protein F5882DRAFT_404801 [Hyaloscypha sp. PMI_1271]
MSIYSRTLLSQLQTFHLLSHLLLLHLLRCLQKRRQTLPIPLFPIYPRRRRQDERYSIPCHLLPRLLVRLLLLQPRLLLLSPLLLLLPPGRSLFQVDSCQTIQGGTLRSLVLVLLLLLSPYGGQILLLLGSRFRLCLSLRLLHCFGNVFRHCASAFGFVWYLGFDCCCRSVAKLAKNLPIYLPLSEF